MERQKVEITGINVSVFDLITFLGKLVIAAVPAAILVAILFFMLTPIIGLFFGR